jgi:hypothetical protein
MLAAGAEGPRDGAALVVEDRGQFLRTGTEHGIEILGAGGDIGGDLRGEAGEAGIDLFGIGAQRFRDDLDLGGQGFCDAGAAFVERMADLVEAVDDDVFEAARAPRVRLISSALEPSTAEIWSDLLSRAVVSSRPPSPSTLASSIVRLARVALKALVRASRASSMRAMRASNVLAISVVRLAIRSSMPPSCSRTFSPISSDAKVRRVVKSSTVEPSCVASAEPWTVMARST